jgi:hypothetical protein
MAHRIINMDDEAKTLTIVLGGKEWEIKRTVIAVRDKWNLYLDRADKFQKRVLDIVKQDGATVDQVVQEFTEWKADFIEGLVKQILESNGYDYDGDWWANNASYDDIVRFIYEIATKDDTDKKKAAD